MRLSTSLARILAALALAIGCASPAIAQTLPAGTIYHGDAISARNNWQTPSTIEITDAGAIPFTGQNVFVRLNGFVSASAGDLRLYLLYMPSNAGVVTRSAQLFDWPGGGPGGARSFAGDYVFGSGSGSDFDATLPGGVVRSGEYAAFTSDFSEVFNGVALAGRWTLLVDDWLSTGGSTIESWDLIVAAPSTTTAPEPATVVLLGSGLAVVAAVRRRRRAARAPMA
jgi:hypothetical protein